VRIPFKLFWFRLELMRRFLHHPRREGDREAAGSAAVSTDGGKKRKPLEKWAFRGVYPSSSLVRCPVEPYIRLLMSGLWIALFAVL
jgi:hypothetical protein